MNPLFHPLSPAELDKCLEWAIERRRFHISQKDPTKKVTPSASDLEIDYLGIRGEYAVWRHFHGRWLRKNGTNPGWDIERGSFRCEVKSTTHRHGRFLLKPDETLLAEVGYLVVEGPGRNVTIAGCITREDFYKYAKLTPMGHPEIPFAVERRFMSDPRLYFLS